MNQGESDNRMKESSFSEKRAGKTQDNRIVVLGGLGFLGSHICRTLVHQGYFVRIFDKLYAQRSLIEDFANEVEVIEGDISRADDVLDALLGYHTAIDLVHTTVPGSSMKDPVYDVTSNLRAAVSWLPHLGETGIKRFLYISSGGTVYGLPRTNPITEEHPTNPISSYGITKLAIEKYVAMYCGMQGIKHRILRPSNVYGEGQRLNIGQGVIGVLADLALNNKPLEIWGTGENQRDYLHVEDLAESVVSLLTYEGSEHVFNVSSEEGHSVLDIVNTLRDTLGLSIDIKHLPDRGFDVPSNILSSEKLRIETGWTPRVSWEAGISRTVRWLKSLKE